MKKVLIVSYYFPPINNIAAKRYGRMCKYMKQYGYEPYVLTTHPRHNSSWFYGLDAEIPIDESHIIRIGSTEVVYPIDSYIINIIIDEQRRKNKVSRVLDESGIGWYCYVKSNLDLELFKGIDIVIGTFPPLGNLLVAELVSQKLKIPYIAEVRDLISDYTEGFSRTEIGHKVDVISEKIILHNADGIVCVTKGFSSTLKKRYPGKRVCTVYNGWDGRLKTNDRLLNENNRDIYYAGTLYEHRIESLRLLFEAIREDATGIRVVIRSLGPDILNRKLASIVSDMGIEQKVELRPPVEEKTVNTEQRKAWINLLPSSLDGSDQALMTTIPGKLYELIRLQQPVLAITDHKAEINEILSRTKKGIVVSSVKEIEDFLQSDMKPYIGYHKEVEYYSRKNQTRRLCRFLDQILGE